MKFAQSSANLRENFRTNLSANRNKNSCVKSNFDIRSILAVKFGVASVKSQANLATNLGVKWRIKLKANLNRNSSNSYLIANLSVAKWRKNADLKANLKINSGAIKTKSQTNF